jgi:hypothetical protein
VFILFEKSSEFSLSFTQIGVYNCLILGAGTYQHIYDKHFVAFYASSAWNDLSSIAALQIYCSSWLNGPPHEMLLAQKSHRHIGGHLRLLHFFHGTIRIWNCVPV